MGACKGKNIAHVYLNFDVLPTALAWGIPAADELPVCTFRLKLCRGIGDMLLLVDPLET